MVSWSQEQSRYIQPQNKEFYNEPIAHNFVYYHVYISCSKRAQFKCHYIGEYWTHSSITSDSSLYGEEILSPSQEGCLSSILSCVLTVSKVSQKYSYVIIEGVYAVNCMKYQSRNVLKNLSPLSTNRLHDFTLKS